ncbi:unnamed protein product [Pleuronectes platessa]|uniref:Uncharacterized protein n=1 Tax=Pleuronectes platessa TaxID=8262 RepID=A0A9N7TMY9_PLEPL|nr:unnamed protein product [Pleuronectes platessa]
MFRAVFGNRREGGGKRGEKKSQRHSGVEVHTHSTLQRGSGAGRGRRHQEHDGSYPDSSVKPKRLTRGASISLPSSPLLPRQADMAPSHSCIRFQDLIWGGLISLSLSLSLSLSPISLPISTLNPSLPLTPSLPPTLPALPPSPRSLFAVAKGRVKKLEYVEGSSSAREPLVFASCRGKTDHRASRRVVDQEASLRLNWFYEASTIAVARHLSASRCQWQLLGGLMNSAGQGGCGSLEELGLEVAASEQSAAHDPGQADLSGSRGRGRTLLLPAPKSTQGSSRFTARPLHYLHVEPRLGPSLSTQELMTRLCFLLGEATPGTASSPMEDRREKKCDTSAQGGSPSSTLTCSTTSPCSDSPTSTLSTSAGGPHLPQPLHLPSHQCSSSTSPSGTLSSPVPSPAPGPAPGPLTWSSPGPPSQSPTSTLESKDSGIIATITSSSENEERSASSEFLTKDEGPVGGAGVMGHVSEERHVGPTKDHLTAHPDEALPRSDIMEPRTPPAPKRPLPQHHVHSTSSLVMPRPNSVAGAFQMSVHLWWEQKKRFPKEWIHSNACQFPLSAGAFIEALLMKFQNKDEATLAAAARVLAPRS